MKRPKLIIFFSFLLIPVLSLIAVNSCAQTNEVSLTTYYPAPFGAYDRIKLIPHDNTANPIVCKAENEGIMYYDKDLKALRVCTNLGFLNFSFVESSSIWVRDNSNNYIHPFNLSDFVGIGTDTPAQLLHVSGGNALFEPNVTVQINGNLGVNMAPSGTYAIEADGNGKVNKLYLKADGVNTGELKVLFKGTGYYAVYAPD